jgi:uncharacterized small protein (DUF1192 family)
MAIDPDDIAPKIPKTVLTVGEDISSLSHFELEARIAELETEIARTREAMKARALTKNAAAAFFKK